jgi:ABC-type amino acid transport substrate-binding protein
MAIDWTNWRHGSPQWRERMVDRKASPNWRLFWLIFSPVALLWLFPPLAWGGDAPTRIELTPAEQAWLAANPEIRLGSDKSWVPYVKLQADGRIVGIEPEILARVNQLTGANIRLELGQWGDIVQRAERGELHGLATSVANPERAVHFLFSDSYYTASRYIYTLKDASPRSMDELAGKKVGFLRGSLVDQKLLARWPGIFPVSMDTP